MITLYLLPLLLLSVIPAYIAQTKGKSFGSLVCIWFIPASHYICSFFDIR